MTNNLLAINGSIIGGLPIASENLKLLWENPDPASAFAAQTINLSAGDYDFLLIMWGYGTSADPRYCPSVIVAKGSSVQLNCATSTANGVGAIYRNITYVSDTSLAVLDAALKDMNQSAVVNNNLEIPLAIYGVYKKSIANTEASKCMLSDGVTSVESVIEKVSYFSEIIPQTGYTLTDGYAYVINGVKYVNLRFDLGTGISTRTKIATMPSSLKPSKLTVRYVATASTAYNSMLNTIVSGYLHINGDLYAGDNLSGTTIKEVDVLITYM